MTEATGSAVLTVAEMEAIMGQIEGGADSGRPDHVATVAASTPNIDKSNPLFLKEFVNPEQLKKDVEFDPRDLDNCVRNHASLFVHYSNLARLARRQFERMKAANEILESRLDALWREQLKKDGGKATEAQIASAVKSDSRWWAAQQRLIDARAIYDLANDSREAFCQRRDMIVQVSVDRRQEASGQLRIGTTDDARTRALSAATGAHQAAQAVR